MAVVLLKVKGAPLTKEEMDGNFEDLDQRLKALKECLDGVRPMVREDDVMVSASLPFKKEDFLSHVKGRFSPGTAYGIADMVSYDNGLYVCQKETSSIDFEEEAWLCLFKVKAQGGKSGL